MSIQYHKNSGKRIPAEGMPKKPKGVKSTVYPIRDRSAIERIKINLYPHTRNYALFVLGINTALRANELLSLKVKHVRNLKENDELSVYQRKTDRDRVVLINGTVIHALQRHIRTMRNDDFLFRNNRQHNTPISVSYLGTLVKNWCAEVGLTENYGSHTLRKTWGYMQRKYNNASTLLLKQAFGHHHEWQTIAYLGVENEEIAQLYKMRL